MTETLPIAPSSPDWETIIIFERILSIMGYAERRKLYAKIERIRKRPLIAYVTSSRDGDGGGRMAPDVITEFCAQISKIPKTEKSIDLLIVSNGGDPIVPWRIITLLRERFKNIGVLVPFSANSAATLLALGADQIVMHPFANFGPVDPQITGFTDQGVQTQFSADHLTYYLDFVKNEVGLSEQGEMGAAFQHLCDKVSALDIGMARKSTKLTESLGKKLLLTHMKTEDKADNIVTSLNKSFYHHGYTIGRKEAKDLGLPIKSSTKEIEDLLWDVWLDFEGEMKCRIPFDPLIELITTGEYREKLGLDTSNGISKDTYEQLSTALSDGGIFNFELLHASLESTRLCCGFHSLKQLTITKTPDLKLNYHIGVISNGYWRRK